MINCSRNLLLLRMILGIRSHCRAELRPQRFTATGREVLLSKHKVLVSHRLGRQVMIVRVKGQHVLWISYSTFSSCCRHITMDTAIVILEDRVYVPRNDKSYYNVYDI